MISSLLYRHAVPPSSAHAPLIRSVLGADMGYSRTGAVSIPRCGVLQRRRCVHSGVRHHERKGAGWKLLWTRFNLSLAVFPTAGLVEGGFHHTVFAPRSGELSFRCDGKQGTLLLGVSVRNIFETILRWTRSRKGESTRRAPHSGASPKEQRCG
jgi:hypothetical protein